MVVKAVLFDLDGTLIDSCPDISAALDKALSEQGFEPAGLMLARQWIGNGARKLVERALAAAKKMPEDELAVSDVDELLAVYLAYYREKCCHSSKLYDGVLAVLGKLHAAKIAMAIVTNKPLEFTQQISASYGLDEYCDVLVGGDCLPTRKPEPAMLLRAAEMLGLDIQSSVMVGDSSSDILAAKAAGITSYGLSYGYNRGDDLAMLGARKVYDKFIDLEAVLL